jgi:hypothetical protein
MTERTNPLREHYSALSDDELQHVAIDGGLTDDARELLEQELGRRGIHDLGEYKEHLQRVDLERLTKKQQALERKERSIRLYIRLGYGLAVFILLVGLFVLYVQKNEKAGVGIIIAGVVLFPLVWINATVGRLVWRFLLRP